MTTPDDSGNSRVSVPRPAATILLLRQASSGVEVLMVRRHANLAFMGGMWVFPGGTLHASDTSEQALAMLDVPSLGDRLQLRDLQGQPLAPSLIAGLAFAACRETFEETGVLLACRKDGTACDHDAITRMQKHRDAVNNNAALFIELLQEENLRPDTSTLTYWSHWITPSSGPKRFDTRFFVVRAPRSHLASADASETVDSCWMTPADLLTAARSRDMPISHPTQCNLYDLQSALLRHPTLDRCLAEEGNRSVHPVLPKMFREADHSVMVMPWDASYETSPGEGIPLRASDCPALAELPSRVPFRENPRT